MAATKSIRGSETEKYIVTAYLAESSAYTRYIFYAKQAAKENYYPVQKVFESTAYNELHHSKVFFKMLQGGKVEVPVSADSGVIGKTTDNLATAAEEELYEGVELYTKAAEVADKEGFADIASHFRAIATVEAAHRERFIKFKKMVDDGTLWKRPEPVVWKCMVCGYEYTGTEPPQTCPGCDHPYQHYFAVGDDDLVYEED